MPPPPEHPKHHKLLGRLVLETEVGSFLGGTRIRLLEAIGQHGSISQAAKSVPLSYKAAWDAVDAMNNLADEPLVERIVGNHRGGGTQLTDYGRRMIAYYRALEENYQQMLDRSAQELHASTSGDVGQFRALLRRMAMKTSARNQFVGPISALRDDAAHVEVSLRLDEQNELTATITRASAERLELHLGKEVYALVKAHAVTLTTDAATRSTARDQRNQRNQLWGTVSSIHPGPAHAEVGLALPGGRTVVAVVPCDGVPHIGFAEGEPACALIDAASVILAVFD